MADGERMYVVRLPESADRAVLFRAPVPLPAGVPWEGADVEGPVESLGAAVQVAMRRGWAIRKSIGSFGAWSDREHGGGANRRPGNLVLRRRVGEGILVGDNIVVSVVEVGGGDEGWGYAKIAVEAPRGVEIWREELRPAWRDERKAREAARDDVRL